MPITLKGSGQVIVQIVQVVKTDTFTTTTNGYQDVTGLSATITPTSSSNKIYVIADVGIGNESGNLSSFRLLRDATVIYGGNANGSRTQGFVGRFFAESRSMGRATPNFIDSPSTTSAVTYKVQCNTEPTYLVAVNRPILQDLNDYRGIVTASSITLMEISG